MAVNGIGRVVIMTRTRRTACPGSGGGGRGLTCNVDRRGKMDGDRNATRPSTRQIRTKFDLFDSLALLYATVSLPSIVSYLSQYLVPSSQLSFRIVSFQNRLTIISRNIVNTLPVNVNPSRAQPIRNPGDSILLTC
jgi:hypothetical protein